MFGVHIMSYELRRVIGHNIVKTDEWDKHDIKLSTQIFILSDEEFSFLKKLEEENEYKYIKYDNIIYLDRMPSRLEEGINQKLFIEDYTNNLNRKFFISYYYKEVEDEQR